MVSKKLFLISVLFLVFLVVALFHLGCSESGRNRHMSQEGEPTSSSDPQKMASKDSDQSETLTQRTGENPMVLMETSMGNIKIELFRALAPVSVENFLTYVNENFYFGTIFHRVVRGFVIQGGGFTEEMEKKPTHAPIKNEAKNGLSNTRGTVAMARTSIINSATSQFYINLKDNTFLDHQDESTQGYGYCVFGKVIEGMDVVDNIGMVPTTRKGRHENVPITPVFIKSVRLL